MKHLSALNRFFWNYRWRLLLGIIFVILSNYFKILSPQLTKYVVDVVVEKATHTGVAGSVPQKQNDIIVQAVVNRFRTLSFENKILWSGITLFILAIISGFFMFMMRQTLIVMSRLIEFDQKNQVYAHYQQLDTGFYKTHSTGDLMNRISEDV